MKANAAPKGDLCRLCGARPTTTATFRQGVGKLLARQVQTVEGPFCRDCGLGLGRSMLNATLWTGWWGIIAFFANFGYVFGNMSALGRLNRLSAPQGATSTPLSPGKPVLSRSGIWFAAALLAAVVAVFAVAGSSDTSNSAAAGSGAGGGSLRWRDGACFIDLGDQVQLTRCGTDDDGFVVAETGSVASCPNITDSYIQANGRVYCLLFY